MARDWTFVDTNGDSTPTDLDCSHFRLSAPPKTDIWRPTATQDDFNAPHMYTSVTAGKFRRLSVRVSAKWKTKYDQGGLLLLWPHAAARNKRRWIKIGVEFEGVPSLSVVGCDRYSDWSLSPAAEAMVESSDRLQGVTFEVERQDNSLWVYVVSGSERTPIREVRWPFAEEGWTSDEMWAGAYAAKPTPDSDDVEASLNVVFDNLELDTE